MSNLEQTLIKTFLALVESLGFELLDIEFMRGRISRLRVYIDSEDSVNVDDSANLSHQVSVILNVKNPIVVPYTLEFSSAGLDRPIFTTEQHYTRFFGKESSLVLRTVLKNHRKYQGTIKAVDGEIITLTVEGKNKVFALNNIRKANLLSHFNSVD